MDADRRMWVGRGAVLAEISLGCAWFLCGCAIPTDNDIVVLPDRTVHIAGMPLPDSGMTDRALNSLGNTWRIRQFVGRCSQGGDMVVGFLGGSITEGTGATDVGSRYSSLLTSWLSDAFPQSSFVEVNAGVGATNSRFGCSRVGHDVLSRCPDLIVLDFSVNDYGSDAFVRGPYEGIVRRCLLDARQPALVAIGFTTRYGGDPRIHGIHQSVTAHYAVPFVSYRDAVSPLQEYGDLPWDSIAVDEVHPSNKGHMLAAALLWECLRAASTSIPAATDTIPRAPVYTDAYDSAGILTPADTSGMSIGGTWDVAVSGRGNLVLRSSEPGDSLGATIRRPELTIGWRRSGQLNSRVDVQINPIGFDTALDAHLADDWGAGYTCFTPLVFPAETGEALTLSAVCDAGGEFVIEYVLFAGTSR